MQAVLLTIFILLNLLPMALSAQMLQGEVAEERRLPLPDWQRDVLPALVPGRPWNDTLLPRSFTQEEWVMIPRWLAGAWQTTGTSYDYTVVNGQLAYQGTTAVRASQTYGEQVDNHGDIWDLLRFPSTRLTETPTTFSYFVSCGARSNNANSTNKYMREASSIEISVDKASQSIQFVRNRIDRFTEELATDGTLIDTDEVLGSNGYPSLVLQTKDIRVSPFIQVDIGPTTGINVRQSFRQFLVNNGMTNLLPISNSR